MTLFSLTRLCPAGHFAEPWLYPWVCSERMQHINVNVNYFINHYREKKLKRTNVTNGNKLLRKVTCNFVMKKMRGDRFKNITDMIKFKVYNLKYRIVDALNLKHRT